MKRPELKEIPVNEAMTELLSGKPICSITMSPGQWDAMLQAGYDTGWTLLEIDANEKPVKAYRK